MHKTLTFRPFYHTVIIFLGLIGLVACSTSQPSAANLSKSISATNSISLTKIFLVRHAEKDLADKSDPALTQQGATRANNLAKLLTHTKLDAIFSTDTRRTRDTAEPTAQAKALSVTLYDARAIDHKKFLERIAGQTVLVVGHSNTIPAFTNALLDKQQYSDLDESEYNSVFVVDIIGDSRQAHRYLID